MVMVTSQTEFERFEKSNLVPDKDWKEISTTLMMIEIKVTVAIVTNNKKENGLYLSSHLKGKIIEILTFIAFARIYILSEVHLL
jgi:hypothetical protein